VSGDAETLVAWLREAADELEKAHAYLDATGAPRRVPGSVNECTLVARVSLLLDERAEQAEKDLDAAVGWLRALGWIKHEEDKKWVLVPERMSDGRIR
jgi:hypothetical protein